MDKVKKKYFKLVELDKKFTKNVIDDIHIVSNRDLLKWCTIGIGMLIHEKVRDERCRLEKLGYNNLD